MTPELDRHHQPSYSATLQRPSFRRELLGRGVRPIPRLERSFDQLRGELGTQVDDAEARTLAMHGAAPVRHDPPMG